MFNNTTLKPLNIGTCLLNRHYVNTSLKNGILQISKKVSKRFPQSTVFYLDANFPFWNGFPLFPHLSHNDGKKLDLTFFYKDKKSQKPVTGSPSFIGYGLCERPIKGEINMPKICKDKGYWQYNLLRKITPQQTRWRMDESRTRYFLQQLAGSRYIHKIFIEPHLKKRLGLSSQKFRFHGCQAVRHDDHIHIQM